VTKQEEGMQDGGREARRAEAVEAYEELPADAAAFSARLAAMSPAEREATFPVHSDGQVCR
jgi:hypothetical protein